jgi:hypothetical protein
MKFTIVKQFDNSFKLAYDSDYEKAKKLKPGDLLECEIKKPRNYQFHKKYFALINMLFDNQEIYNNIDHLRHDLILEAGFYDLRNNIQGAEVKEVKSISFAKMTEEEFENLYSKTLDVIIKYFNFDKQTIIDNVEQYF